MTGKWAFLGKTLGPMTIRQKGESVTKTCKSV